MVVKSNNEKPLIFLFLTKIIILIL